MATAPLVAKISTKGAKKATDELKKVGQQAKKTESNVIQMGDSFKKTGKQASLAASAITGPLGGVASRITAITALLSSGAGAATVFGLAITGVGFALAEGVQELDRINVELAKTEAILKATGFASGKTSQQLLEQARAIGLATLASTQGIQQAQAKLLTFDKIHGQVFDDAINLTQDLATVFGGDASSQATLLGKALQKPLEGLTALRRVGVSFTEQQKEQVKALVKAGDTMKAQTIIVAALQAQVGGAGEAVAKDSLAGKLDTAGQLWSEFAGKLAASSGTFSLTEKLLDGMIGRFNELNKALEPESTNELFEKRLNLMFQIANLEDKIASRGASAARSQLEGQLKSLQSEADSLSEQIIKSANKDNDEILKASDAHEKSQLKIKADSVALQIQVEEDARSKQISADLDFYDRRQEFLEAQNKKSNEANKQAYIDDAETYGTMLKLKADADKTLAMQQRQAQSDQLSTLGSTTTDLGSLLGEQNALFKTAAITQATINTYNAATGAYAALAPIPFVGPALGAAAAGVALGAGFANVRAISAREQGGSLSAGQSSTIAERGQLEIVTPQNASRIRTKQQMQSIMGGNSGGGDMKVTIINQGTNTQVNTEQREDGELIVLIIDTLAQQISTPNSKGDKALTARGQRRAI